MHIPRQPKCRDVFTIVTWCYQHFLRESSIFNQDLDCKFINHFGNGSMAFARLLMINFKKQTMWHICNFECQIFKSSRLIVTPYTSTILFQNIVLLQIYTRAVLWKGNKRDLNISIPSVIFRGIWTLSCLLSGFSKRTKHGMGDPLNAHQQRLWLHIYDAYVNVSRIRKDCICIYRERAARTACWSRFFTRTISAYLPKHTMYTFHPLSENDN